MSHPKSWILVAGQDYQADGILAPGQILTNPYDPASALLPRRPSKIPDSMKMEGTTKEFVDMQFNDSLGTAFQAWVEMNGGFAGAGIGGGAGRQTSTTWKVKSISSSIFTPTIAYAKSVLEMGDVPQHTKWWQFERLYIVTGVRIASGASMVTTEYKTVNAGAGAGINMSSHGIPASIGGAANIKGNKRSEVSVKHISDFVFAYRLSRIIVFPWVSHRPSTHGEIAEIVNVERCDAENAPPPYDSYEIRGVIEAKLDEKQRRQRLVSTCDGGEILIESTSTHEEGIAPGRTV
ncbi:hypothetical protein BDV26DRAFT_96393 [Aspergillus bertholletiae]|uniref:Uncharacterized protein n=1 Tax=Aspergillus bertholletiae TaxID=1226010 RepID=A0A5N7BHQ5_9EURO|nr:hypothetical protein BDV26DRAFT_96393 [Aspergillus bertholletiae]